MNILIICPNCNEETIYPACKQAYYLAEYLSISNQVIVLAKQFDNNYKYVDKRKFVIETLPDCHYQNIMVDKWLESGNYFKKIYALYKRRFLTRDFDIIDFKKWLKCKKIKFDLIISWSYPFFTHRLALIAKRFFRHAKNIIFMLDPYADNLMEQSSVAARIVEENKIFIKSDKIFTTKLIYEKSNYSMIKNFSDKVSFVPDTFIYDRTKYSHISCNKNIITLSYFGQFIKSIRNPLKMIDIFKNLTTEFKINLYYRGCEDIVTNNVGDNVALCEYIRNFEKFNQKVGEANFLLSLGNTINNQNPSKIFEYVCFGKPIIHFYQNDEDKAKEYFANYPYIKFIDYRLDPKIMASMVIDFCKEMNGKKVDYSIIQSLFPHFTVNYIANLIEDTIDCN